MTANPFAEAGSVLAAIKRSEKQRDTTIGHAQDRHYDRVQRILAEASPEARALVVAHLKPGPHAAQIASEAAETVEAPQRDGMCGISGCEAAAVPGFTMCAIHGDKYGEDLEDPREVGYPPDLSTLSPRLTADPGPSTALIKERSNASR